MDSARYWLALVAVVGFPPVLLYWFLIHPFVRFWRRLGVRTTYACVVAVLVVCAAGLFLIRKPLLSVDLGTHYAVAALGAVCLASAAWMRLRINRQVTGSFLAGLPELDPGRVPGKVVAEGIYSKMRHPRYVELTIAFAGWALLANYLAPYVFVALWIPAMYFITVLEEKELLERFGEPYEEYRRRVPRFLPRRRLDG